MDAEVSGIFTDIWRKSEWSKKLIEEGDSDANFAYFALHKLHILPSTYLNMDVQEKAFVVAAIQIKMENDKKQKKKAEAKVKKKGRW